jgi:hypothetical protein
MHSGFWLGNMTGIVGSDNLDLDGGGGGNIKIYLKLLGLGRGNWICLAQDWKNRPAFANTAMKIQVSLKAENLSTR